MNLPQAKSLLEKIITLYKTLSADEKNISPIERDLMLSYVRQLYESFLDAPSVSTATKTVQTPVQAPVQPTPMPKPEAPKYIPPAPAPPPPPPPPQPKPLFNQPVEQPRQPIIETPPVVVETPPPAPTYVPLPPPPPVERAKPVSHSVGLPSDIEALFSESTGNELSDRLSNTAISDLSKAFGLNDRLLAQNELFGGSKMVFDEAIKDLNNMSSFETAKNVIASLAAKYNWTATEDRKKQAKFLIKLVKRRFK